MFRLILIIQTVIFLSGCAMSSPIERAEAICLRLGDPSPACKERQFNIERTRQDAFMAEQRKSFQQEADSSTLSKPAAPQKSHYDQLLDEGREKIKQDCAVNGGKYLEDFNGASCIR